MAVDRDRTRLTRLVARQISEMQMSRYRRWQVLVPQARIIGVVFLVVLGGSIAHHPLRDLVSGDWLGIEEAGMLGRAVSATAVAHSMGLPHTTVRRSALELIGAGLMTRCPAGFLVPAAFFTDGRLAQVVDEDAADLMRVLALLADAGHAPAAAALAAGVAGLPPGLVERLLLTFSLRTLESFTALYGDFPSGAIMVATIAANIRHITDDPQLSRHYAGEDTPPPDALRRPVSLRALARALDAPFETVRRRVATLVAAGKIEAQAGGIIVPTRVLLDDGHRDNNRRNTLHFDQMVQGLVALRGEPRPAR